jgi:predicted DNA-binding antitoxin AbrB/MazE fold protein
MKTIRAIFRGGALQPLDPVNLPENTHLTVALFDGDELPADAIATLAQRDPSFEFLDDPREAVYSPTDGES